MKAKKLNLDDFMGYELPSKQRMNIRGGDTTAPEIDEDGNPVGGNTSTGSNGGDIKPPRNPIIVIINFEP